MLRIDMDLSVDSIESAIQPLKDYSDDLAQKNQTFIDLLLDVGIRVAEDSISGGTHTMPQRITFYKDYEVPNEQGITGLVVGVGETFFSHWKDANGGVHDDEVFPLAMMEFGSAGLALAAQNAYGGYGGRGTFSSGGASNLLHWFFDTDEVDEEGHPIRKHATAIAPTRPMYNAMQAMMDDIQDCAIKAYGSQ